jgi:membrane protease YdiL (CAAX protease family)
MNGLLTGSSLLSRSFVVTIVSLAVVFAVIARGYISRYSIPLPASAGIYLAFMMLLVLSLAPAWLRRSANKPAGPRRALFVFVPLWCSSYLLYAAGTGDFRWPVMLKLLTLAALPVAIYSLFPPRSAHRFSWQDGCVAVVLIGFVLSRQLRGIWNVPVNLDFLSRLFLITVGSWCWVFVRPVPELGYSLRINKEVAKQAVINFALFAAIAIPSSLAMQFTRWNPRWPGIGQFLVDALGIFLFIALLEELFFRGFLQSLLSATLRSWLAGQVIVSLLFGLFHILHAPFPNWKYVALASVAGWFYGSAYRLSGSIMASSLVHAAVDTVWRTWFQAR